MTPPKPAPAGAIGATTWPGTAKLTEECGEALQIVGKLMAYPDEPHPDGEDAPARFQDEIADLAAALDYILWANADRLDTEAVRQRQALKFHRFRSWHHKEHGR